MAALGSVGVASRVFDRGGVGHTAEMRLAQAIVALKPGAPEPVPGAGVEVTRHSNARRFRARREDGEQAVADVRGAMDAYMAVAGDQARPLGPVALVPDGADEPPSSWRLPAAQPP